MRRSWTAHGRSSYERGHAERGTVRIERDLENARFAADSEAGPLTGCSSLADDLLEPAEEENVLPQLDSEPVFFSIEVARPDLNLRRGTRTLIGGGTQDQPPSPLRCHSGQVSALLRVGRS